MREAKLGMKRVAPVIGIVLIVLACGFFLQALHVLPAISFIRGRWASLGWGSWALAFGAGFLVWARGARAKP
jgi:hypothetical protein